MDHLCEGASAVCVRLAGLADWLHGCSHGRTTFPITLRTSVSVKGRQSTQSETYIVCLECGRHFAYDWATMCIQTRFGGWARRRSGEISVNNDISRTAIESIRLIQE